MAVSFLRPILCVILLSALNPIAVGADELLRKEISPEAIQSQIAERGVQVVHDEIFANHFASNMVLLAIDSGQTDWLDVASALLTRENPQTEDMLYRAIGEALQWSPISVLKRSDLDLVRVCSTQGLYEWRLFSRFLAETAIDRRMASVQGIKDFRLAQNRTVCLKALEEAKATVVKIMDNRVPAD